MKRKLIILLVAALIIVNVVACEKQHTHLYWADIEITDEYNTEGLYVCQYRYPVLDEFSLKEFDKAGCKFLYVETPNKNQFSEKKLTHLKTKTQY